MDNLTLIDLRKILQNHNKTLKKKMFKLTGGRAKLLEIVKKNFKVRSKTDKVINIIHSELQKIKSLRISRTQRRSKQYKIKRNERRRRRRREL